MRDLDIEELAARPGVASIIVHGKPSSLDHGKISRILGSTLEPLAVDPDSPDLAMSEKEFQAKVLAYARGRGFLCYHTHDSKRSEPGFPDVVAVRGDRLIFAELKTMKGKPTADQKKWAKAIMRAGCVYYLWRPADWPEIKEVFS